MRRAASSSIRFAPLLSVLLVPACFSLPKADVSTHVIDDFAEDASMSLVPTWGAFSPWTCDAFTIRDQNNGGTGADGGAVLDAGQPPSLDGGPPVSCTLGPGMRLVRTDWLPPSISPHRPATWAWQSRPTRSQARSISPDSNTSSSPRRCPRSTRTTNKVPQATTLEVELGCRTAMDELRLRSEHGHHGGRGALESRQTQPHVDADAIFR